MIRSKLSRRTILNVGMASLLAAVIVPRLLTAGSVNADLIDGLQGLFFGISIGFNLLWVYLTSRKRRNSGS